MVTKSLRKKSQKGGSRLKSWWIEFRGKLSKVVIFLYKAMLPRARRRRWSWGRNRSSMTFWKMIRWHPLRPFKSKWTYLCRRLPRMARLKKWMTWYCKKSRISKMKRLRREITTLKQNMKKLWTPQRVNSTTNFKHRKRKKTLTNTRRNCRGDRKRVFRRPRQKRKQKRQRSTSCSRKGK